MIYIKNIAILLLLLRVALQYSAESCGRKLREPVKQKLFKVTSNIKNTPKHSDAANTGEFNSELVFLICLFLFYKFSNK